MKKIITMIACLMTMVVLTGCGCTYNVTANYDVCYPDGTLSYSETTIIENAYTVPIVVCYSFNGTNYVSVSCSDNPMTNSKKAEHYITTTAPIRLNSYNVNKIKSKNKKPNRYNEYYWPN